MLGISQRFRVRSNSGSSSLTFSVAFVLARRFTPVPRKVDRLHFGPITSREVSSPSPPLSLSLHWVMLCWWGGGDPLSPLGWSAGLSLGAHPGGRVSEREGKKEREKGSFFLSGHVGERERKKEIKRVSLSRGASGWPRVDLLKSSRSTGALPVILLCLRMPTSALYAPRLVQNQQLPVQTTCTRQPL